ncbi:MAG: MBL fold metallo-hydrolase [Nitrospirae bacterium]|nr:MBL fold metallo-hydrolase [Nitrospirota bacterium]
MIAISLQSGSNGNCTYVETGSVKLLFDAGIPGIQAGERLSAFGRDIKDIDALIISHDHSDHVRYAGVYQRKYGLPIYITPRTLDMSENKYGLGRLNNVNYFMAGETIKFDNVTVQTIPCPHDGVDGAVFVISSNGKRLGIMTDLGHAFKDLYTFVPSLDGIFIESNYDPEMLANGPYPAFLKQRIRGPKGHLSNREAAELLLTGRRLKWACLSHLSNNNNDPETALQTHKEIVGDKLTLFTASRHTPTGILKL